MEYFDSHAHYWDKRFSCELGEGEPERLLSSLFGESVSHIVNVATDPETARLAIAQARRFPSMVTALGIHPSDCEGLSLETAVADIKALLLDPQSKAVALGEIGLDYHYDTPRELQKRFFRAQMALARELSLPVVIHDREAHGDVMEILREFPGVTGIVHSFSGSYEMAREAISLGYLISFSGTLTFKNAERVRSVAERLPLERILIETDAPYLAPHPHRGKINHSGYLAHTNETLASLFHISPEEAAKATEENAKRIFRMA